MKNIRVCPKCGSNHIVSPRYTVAPKNTGAFDSVPLGAFTAARIHRYICTDCGYVEFWIEQPDLDQVRKRYPQSREF